MSNKPRFRIGTESQKTIFDGNYLVAVASDSEHAKEIVDIMNGAVKNDRRTIVEALRRESNRIFNKQERDYPSNTIDILANNIAMGVDDFLSEKAHPNG